MLSEKDLTKINQIDSGFITHTSISNAIAGIEKSILISKGSKEPDNVLLTGLAGTGKTTTCNAILSRQKRKLVVKDNYEVTLVEAFYALIPNPVTIKGVASSLLRALGDCEPTKGSAYEMTYRLGKLLHKCETKVIILDELQHLLKRDWTGNTHNVKDWLKSIINEFKVPIVIVGTPECVDIINTDRQLARRFTKRFQLDNLKFDFDERGDFRKFVESLAFTITDELKLQISPDFKRRYNSLIIYAATGGNPADITKLFKTATLNSLERNNKKIELLDFETAFKELVLPNSLCLTSKDINSTLVNPFNLNADELETTVLNCLKITHYK